MWSSIIPMAPEGISVDDFFTNFVPDQFNKVKDILNVVDLSFLGGNDFNMQFNVEEKIYGIKFKHSKDLEVVHGEIDKPALALYVSEKDWRDAVTGKFNKMADDFTGDPTSFMDAKRYNVLQSTNGTVDMNLKKNDGEILPLKVVFNGVENPAVTVNLDMVDGLAMLNRETDGMKLFMEGKLKFTGDMTLLMKLQNLM